MFPFIHGIHRFSCDFFLFLHEMSNASLDASSPTKHDDTSDAEIHSNGESDESLQNINNDPDDGLDAKSRLLLKRVYEPNNNDNDDELSSTSALGDRLSKKAKSIFDEFFQDSVDEFTGWELILSLDIARVVDAFAPAQREKVKTLFAKLLALVNTYAVRPTKFLQDLAKEYNLSSTDDLFTSEDPRIVGTLQKYNIVSLDCTYGMQYVWREVPAAIMDDIYGMTSSLFGIISIQKNMKLSKSDAIIERMKRSTNVACFKPFFQAFNPGYIFGNIKAALDPEALKSQDHSMAVVSLDGSVIVVAERSKSRGLNENKNTFDVLNVANPSLKILSNAFRTLINVRYPNFALNNEYVFVNITEASNTPRIQCLKLPPNMSKYVVVVCNLSGIRVAKYKSSVTPIVHMYANCIFEGLT